MEKKVFGYPKFDESGEMILTTYENEYRDMLMDIRVYKLEKNQTKIFTSDDEEIAALLLNGKIYCMEEFMSAYRVVNQEGSSWSAQNYGKNMSYKYFISSIDIRHFAKKFYRINFKNEYVTFHSGVAGIIKYFLNPTIENRDVFKMIKKEKKFLYLYLIGMAICSVPQILQKSSDEKMYRLEV